MSNIAQEGTTPAPGTGETPPEQPNPESAGTLNADTGGGPPETIPYARFKEVNDRLQTLVGYEELRALGYDPDSLGRLAQFEAAFMNDPVGTWKTMADNLDLPESVRESLDALASGGVTPSPEPAQGESSAPSTAVPQSDPRIDELQQWKDSLEEERAQQASQQLLDRALSHWDSLDKQASTETGREIKTPEKVKLTYIAALGNRGQFTSVEDMAEAARNEAMEFRSSVLGDAIQNAGQTASPLAVPGGGVAPTGPVKFRDLREASRAAKAAMERGELPPPIGA